jgi:sulfite reductase alpha subunit-like flavoprotein
MISASNPRVSIVLKKDCSMRDALLYHYDITSSPRRSHLRLFALHASGNEQARLNLLADSTEEYNRYIVANHINITELLQDFPSLSFHKRGDELLEILPPLLPRFYSIASSSLVNPNTIDIVVAVVKFQTAMNRIHKGVCSNYLASLVPNGKEGKESAALAFVKSSLFRLPEDPQVPVIMIGAGTGIAPFRAFVQERLRRQRDCGGDQVPCNFDFDKTNSTRLPLNTLFFGCNHQSRDFLFHEELETAVKSGELNLQPAFAFDQKQTVFVQHRLVEPANSALVWKLIDQRGGHIYVCGGMQMGKGVFEALTSIVAKEGKMTKEAAASYLTTMQANNKYQLDVF